MMSFKFEALEIWQLSMEIAEEIYSLTKTFPKSETYNLTSQFNRAADSVSLNISEGSIGQSNPEQLKFLGYSIRSIAECVTCLHKAKRRAYITEAEFNYLYHREEQLFAKTTAFKKGVLHSEEKYTRNK